MKGYVLDGEGHVSVAWLSVYECAYNPVSTTTIAAIILVFSAISVWTQTTHDMSCDRKRHLLDHSLTSGHLAHNIMRANHTCTRFQARRHLGNRMGKDLIESLIIIELACAFLAPWLLFHGLIIFIQQFVESTQQISVLPAWHRYAAGAREF